MASAPKYMDIVDWTMGQITAGAFKPRERFLSESALGERFACSRQTVRRALEVLEQRGQISRLQGSGTFISPGTGRTDEGSAPGGEPTMTIGLISTYMDNFIFPSIIRGLEGVLSEGGYALELLCTHNLVSGETRTLQFMMERRLDGLIVEPTRSALPCVNTDLYHTIAQRGIPLVFIDSFYPELTVPYVALDDEKAGYEATRYLLNMGHRSISGVFPHSHRQAHLRYLGYVKAHTEMGIPIQDNLVCWHSRENMNQILYSQHFLEQLKQSTAVLCYNDQTALIIMDILSKNGMRMPEDMSVVGIDNSEVARISSLTSVAHPAEQLGEAAAKLLIAMINGHEGRSILFPPKLFMRHSVKKLEV